MVIFPRLLLGLLATLGVNFALILWSVIGHFQAADMTDTQRKQAEPAVAEVLQAKQDNSLLEDAGLPPALPNNLPNNLPSDLPDVPSLESAENDPGFQEFLDIAAEQFPEISHLKNSRSSRSASVSREYYVQLEQRLKTVQQLTGAAVLLTNEARRFAAAGDQQRSQDFLQRITHLREIAADLLAEEL